jgi:Cys-rich protein (TIGR01571 family)
MYVCADAAGVAFRRSPNTNDRMAEGFGVKVGETISGHIVMGDGGTKQYIQDINGRGFVPLTGGTGVALFQLVPPGATSITVPVNGRQQNIAQPVTGNFSDGLCDCFSDCNSLVLSWCIPCYRWALTLSRAQLMSFNNALGLYGLLYIAGLVLWNINTPGTAAGASACWLVLLLISVKYRGQLRQKYECLTTPWRTAVFTVSVPAVLLLKKVAMLIAHSDYFPLTPDNKLISPFPPCTRPYFLLQWK